MSSTGGSPSKRSAAPSFSPRGSQAHCPVSHSIFAERAVTCARAARPAPYPEFPAIVGAPTDLDGRLHPLPEIFARID
jgi:hypothetical protein